MTAQVYRLAIFSLSFMCFLLARCTSVNITDKGKADLVGIFQEQSLSDYKLLDSLTTNFEFLFKPTKKDLILSRENEELFIDLLRLDENKIRISLANQYGDTLTMEFKGRFEESTFNSELNGFC